MMQAPTQAIVPAPREETRFSIDQEALSIKGFLETSFVDWPGKVVSVLFLPRCNFRCPFCHNHSLVINPEGYDDIPRPYIMARLTELKEWVDGVCISGGEPTIHPRLPSLIAEIKGLGLSVKLDTNGSRPDCLRALLEQGLLDCVAMDIKAPLDEVSYAKAAGAPVDLAAIQESISLLKQGKVEYHFRTTVVPALHKGEDLLHIARHLSGSSPLTLQNFNADDPLDPRLKGATTYHEEWLQGMQERITPIIHQ
jgi:pyruvate formate lyase activating enzyme